MLCFPSDATGRDGKRYCCRGMRAFFARHGLDYDRFRKAGIPAEQLRATGDAMALRVVANAEARRG